MRDQPSLFGRDGEGGPVLAPHQRIAVERVLELLESRAGAILADAVGLGKTWVAIDVARRAMAEGAHVEIIVPASLITNWRTELCRFDVDVSPVSQESLRSRPKESRGRRSGRRGITIVDEAHHFRNRATLGYEALAERIVGRRVLLVTATPVCNGLGDLESLLALIVPDDALRDKGLISISDAFASSSYERLAVVRNELVIRRDSSVLRSSYPFGRVDSRVLRYRIRGADEVLESIGRLRFPLVSSGLERGMLHSFLAHRLASSVEALIESLTRQLRFCDWAVDTIRKGYSVSRSEYRRMFRIDEEGPLQEMLFPDAWFDRAENSESTREAIARERGELRKLIGLTAILRSDKYRRLLDDLRRDSLPTLVFTTAVSTAWQIHSSIQREVPSAIVTAQKSAVGDLSCSRQVALESFTRRDVDLLVMTDVGSEGINLQRAARVVHFDLPWNPARIDQRIGRANRIGQTRESVESVYLVWDAAPDRRLHEILQTKVRLRRRLESSPAEGDSLDSAGRSEEWERSRRLMPARFPPCSPQEKLLATLSSAGIEDDVLGGLLARRYRCGVERRIHEMASRSPISSDEVEVLRDLLIHDLRSNGNRP